MAKEYSVRWLDPENVTMFDSEGNPVLCNCGEPAGSCAMGNGNYAAWCTECSPLNKQTVQFVYKQPTQDQIARLKNLEFIVNTEDIEDDESI